MEEDKLKLEAIAGKIREWDRKQGHDRCHYYPELFREIAEIAGVDLTSEPYVPTREQMEEGCRMFVAEQFALNPIIVPEDYSSH